VQVVSNLVNNAAKHSPPGSNIEVSLTRDEERALISVRDDGIGLDPELLPRIFDAFYVNHEKNLAKSGLGIGLWLARRLVELHAGTIVARSEGPGRGAEFCATIPLRVTAPSVVS
jgi:signal transduction histidine kinase